MEAHLFFFFPFSLIPNLNPKKHNSRRRGDCGDDDGHDGLVRPRLRRVSLFVFQFFIGSNLFPSCVCFFNGKREEKSSLFSLPMLPAFFSFPIK